VKNSTLQEKIVYSVAGALFVVTATASGVQIYQGYNPPPSFLLITGYGMAYIKDFLREKQVMREMGEEHRKTRQTIRKEVGKDGYSGKDEGAD
jgi:hypothetical protein